ncbi:ATP-binding cassette domain-containing protein [Rhodophyticola sp.]|uniref:ATP-binding cassette domain-containing protein n=1 Tax=Rhodophyticola sp. TaxID=2680032 RepID=UPI003D29C1D3
MQVRGLTVDFDTGPQFVRALHGIDMEIRRGETLGVVGESGCGKSITWLAALGLLGGGARVSGQVLFDGDDLLGMAPRALSTGARRARGAAVGNAVGDVLGVGRQIGEAPRCIADCAAAPHGPRRAADGRVGLAPTRPAVPA